MIDVLLLGRQYGYSPVKEAIEKALDMSCFDVEAVRLLLDAERIGKRERCEAVEIGRCAPMTDRSRRPGTTTSCSGTTPWWR
jgi:hypothetical protein